MRKRMVKKFLEVGRFLFDAGVVEYYSGNLSLKWRNKIFITRSGSPLPLLRPQDVLEVDTRKPIVGKPSSEFVVHKRVYEKTNHSAVAHAHPPSAVAVAFNLSGDTYKPPDNEGKLLLGEIPILRVRRPSASPELAEAVAEALRCAPCAIVHSHGVFCGADSLERAAGFVTALEFSAKIFLLLQKF